MVGAMQPASASSVRPRNSLRRIAEEALQIVDKVGGSVTVMTVGDDESEEVLRREMAMGADKGILLCDEAFEGADGKGIAAILKAAVDKGSYDLIFTGAQADDGGAQVGGMLAAMLSMPPGRVYLG